MSSINRRLDVARHHEIGRSLAELRDEGVDRAHVGCLYIKDLSKIDLHVLTEIVQ